MKIRNGFVSNSSSSSFLIIKKDNTLSRDELIKKTDERYIMSHGEEIEDNKTLKSKAESWADDHKYIFLMTNISYGAEDDAEKLATSLLKIANIKDTEFEWEE